MRAAPTIDLWLMAPAMRNPALYTMRDLDEWVTIRHVLDAREIMAVEAAAAEKARRKQERAR